MKKVMLLAAMLAMVLAAAVPALAQSVTQVGSGNQACVQTAVQAEVGKVQISQYGDNVNIQNIAQECNVNVARSRRSSPALVRPLRLPCSISMLRLLSAVLSPLRQPRCPSGRASPHGWFVAHRARCRCPARSRWSTGPQDRPLSDRTRPNQAGPFGGPLFSCRLRPPGGLYSGDVVDILMSGDLA